MTLYGTCVMLPCVREWVAHNVPWLTVIPLLQLNSPTPSGFHTVPNVQPLVSWLSSVLHDMWYVCVCVQVEVERGMTWVKALEVWKKLKTIEEGFYISTEVVSYSIVSLLPLWTVYHCRLYHFAIVLFCFSNSE